MALKIKTPKLIVNKLILVGHRKNYIVPFKKGFNLIYGDSDTGKSSILNLINYCLGSSSVDLYDEIEIAGNYCLLEVFLVGEIYTIKRNIFNSQEDIEVFRCYHNEIEDYFPKYYSPNFNKVSEDGFFSDFLLSSLNIPITKIKQSPSKEDSKMVSLSFRDIFKFNYLNQDKVGSKKLLGENYAYLAKLKETFKLMFNALDSQILHLEGSISELSKEYNELNKKNKSISGFLRETQIDSLKALEERKSDLESQLLVLIDLLEDIDSKIVADSKELNYLREEITILEKKLIDSSNIRAIKHQLVKQNVVLRNEYANDIRKIIATIEVLNKFPKIKDRDTSCPVCDQSIKLSTLKDQFANTDSESIKAELNGLRRRAKELVKIHDNLREEISEYDTKINLDTEKLEDLRFQFDNQTKKIVTPYVNQRDNLAIKIGSLRSDLKNLHHLYKIRKQQNIIESEILDLENRIGAFRDDLKVLKESAPSLDRVFLKLGNSIEDFLRYVGVKNVNNISISKKTYLPIIRNRDYEKITSGGVRTLSSVGFYLAILEYAINNAINYPSFLMVDTIAKYIGKTNEADLKNTNLEEDLKEGMKDGTKYENIYNYLMGIHDKSSGSFQVIVVDNDIPNTLEKKLTPFIAKHYTANPSKIGDEVGFIDDVYKSESSEIQRNMIEEDGYDVDKDEDDEFPF
ncbi:ATP-binding protein [Mangrovimonas sp. ST2L15]|uniref:ATP-binding protein n=1 Tax=Mangrovimonas sp. ST2L15 TaxID=1645916 RepID=UPI0006B40427|nr:ATP-binding protein [Mangrovimonas sp. ST2L15]